MFFDIFTTVILILSVSGMLFFSYRLGKLTERDIITTQLHKVEKEFEILKLRAQKAELEVIAAKYEIVKTLEALEAIGIRVSSVIKVPTNSTTPSPIPTKPQRHLKVVKPDEEK